MIRHVVFSHGKESGPWGTKIQALSQVARNQGWRVVSLDYQGMDDPAVRVAHLVAAGPAVGPAPVLVGSSMGGHVAAAAAGALGCGGLFLLAPAFFMPGYEHLTPLACDCPVEIVHGWRDEVVPVEHSIRWARSCGATLHVLDDDHRLTERLPEVSDLFGRFLTARCGVAEV